MINPELTGVSPLILARMLPVPDRLPVKVEPVPAVGERLLSVTPPVSFSVVHASAAAFARKLFCESRVMA